MALNIFATLKRDEITSGCREQSQSCTMDWLCKAEPNIPQNGFALRSTLNGLCEAKPIHHDRNEGKQIYHKGLALWSKVNPSRWSSVGLFARVSFLQNLSCAQPGLSPGRYQAFLIKTKLQDEKGFINEKFWFPHEIHNGWEIEENLSKKYDLR